MDTLSEDRRIIEAIIRDYASIPYAYGQVDRKAIFDREGDHYLLMISGWDEGRIHGCIVHVDLIGGKFWIQRDGTEDGIASELEAAGVPKERIVLGFREPKVRPLTGYAVA